MKKDLNWFLRQEVLLEENEKTPKDQKDSKDTSTDTTSKWGEKIDAKGNYGADWRNLLAVWNQDKSKMVSWKQPNKLFQNLGISKKQDWIQTIEQLDKATNIGDIITKTRHLDENTVSLTLASNWRKIADTAHGSKLFILFWCCEVIRAWDQAVSHQSGSRVYPFKIQGLTFYMSGQDILTLHWERRKK